MDPNDSVCGRAAPPLAAVPKILFTEALLCKTQLPPSAVDAAELRNTNLLMWRPKADWLSRRSTTMHNLGMFDEFFDDEKLWLSFLREFPIPPPQQTDFYITKNDLEELEPIITAVLAPCFQVDERARHIDGQMTRTRARRTTL